MCIIKRNILLSYKFSKYSKIRFFNLNNKEIKMNKKIIETVSSSTGLAKTDLARQLMLLLQKYYKSFKNNCTSWFWYFRLLTEKATTGRNPMKLSKLKASKHLNLKMTKF